ncbi:hypothetical protein Q3G72_013829 [Acer saccharum]|nr:hypothetical protein Q3G72_013829 [Acer saccharum]
MTLRLTVDFELAVFFGDLVKSGRSTAAQRLGGRPKRFFEHCLAGKMEPIAAGSASDPKAPAHTAQLMLHIDESASSSQGPQIQNNAPIYNWPILDLLPSKSSLSLSIFT